jgi:hypothetical protein
VIDDFSKEGRVTLEKILVEVDRRALTGAEDEVSFQAASSVELSGED